MKRIPLLIGAFLSFTTLNAQNLPASINNPEQVLSYFSNWTIREVAKGGRIDAIRQLDEHTILCAARGNNRGNLYISHNNGLSWSFLARPSKFDVTCIAETGNKKEFYILTGNAEVWGTQDEGKTWNHLKTLLPVNKNREVYAASYAIMYTQQGTLLVTDTDSDGGHIYRSVDKGKTWQDKGRISNNALYRLEKTGNGIIVNGWEGAIYKSIDDGNTWTKVQQLTKAALFATEYMGMSVMLQADEDGNVYRSPNLGDVWDHITNLKDAADDFVNIGYGAAYYGTYTGKKHVFLTIDYGRNWISMDTIPTIAGDWLDHGIRVETTDSIITLSGTNKGFIIRTAFHKNQLAAHLDQWNARNIAVQENKATTIPPKAILSNLVDVQALNEPEDIITDNGYAYIPCRDGNNVAIIDYRNPQKPVLAHSLTDVDILDAFSVAIENHYLYVLSMTNSVISVFDIQRPEQPVKTASIKVGGPGAYLSSYRSNYTRLRKIIIEDGYAYITHSSEGKVYILDVRQPAKPAIISSFHTGDGAFAALVNKDALYLAGYAPGSSVITVNIKDKHNPIVVSSIYDSIGLQGTCALAIQDKNLYVVAYTAGTIWSLDITNPFEPKTIQTLKDADMKGPGRIAFYKNKAFILNSVNNTVAVVETDENGKMKTPAYLQHPLLKRVYGIAIDKDKLLLAGREAKSFMILDLKQLP